NGLGDTIRVSLTEPLEEQIDPCRTNRNGIVLENLVPLKSDAASGSKVFVEAAVSEMDSPASILELLSLHHQHTVFLIVKKAWRKESLDTNGVKGSDLDSNANLKSKFKMKDIVNALNKLKLNPLAKVFFLSSYYYGQMDTYSVVFSNKSLGNNGFANNWRSVIA
ncbi:4-hydroxy-3-methylbut-2-en-1-yl diphosphatesynthase, partial [Striga asiatica]